MAWQIKAGKTKSGSSSWWLYGANGEMTAWAGQEFSTESNARTAASSFKSGAGSARYEVYQDSGGAWRWRAWRSSDKVAASGESFDSKHNAQRAADAVQANTPYSTGP